LKEVAQKNNLTFIDINELLTEEDFDDGLHPNINGHIKIFDKVSRELDKILAIQHERYAVLVDMDDREIGHKHLDSIDERDVVRVAALWITNGKGEILLAKRPMSKRRDPNRWGPSVATMLEKGHTYLGAIKKAAKDEIGLEGFVVTEGKKLLLRVITTFIANYFCPNWMSRSRSLLNEEEVQDQVV
jgi:isopentenyldiphosphate isomerase